MISTINTYSYSLKKKQHVKSWGWDKIFKCNSLNENTWNLIKISLKFISNHPIKNNPALITWPAPSHYLNWSWLDYWCIYASPSLNELIGREPDHVTVTTMFLNNLSIHTSYLWPGHPTLVMIYIHHCSLKILRQIWRKIIYIYDEMKNIFEVWLILHWSLFLNMQLKLNQCKFNSLRTCDTIWHHRTCSSL